MHELTLKIRREDMEYSKAIYIATLYAALLAENFYPEDVIEHGHEIIQQLCYEITVNNVRFQ